MSDEVKQLALDALSTCRIRGVGSFFLLTSSGLHLVREDDSNEVITYDQYLGFYMGELFVVDEWSLCLMGQACGKDNAETLWIAAEDADWKQVCTESFSSGLSLSSLASKMSNYSLQNGFLSRMRAGDDHDFTLVSNEGSEFPVHRLIMNRQWPYFKDTVGRQELETRLHVDVSESVLETIVAHLYEQNKPLFFETAVALVTAAHKYQLTNLLLEAMGRIKTYGVGFEEAVEIWKLCHVTGNRPLRLYCSDAIFRATGNSSPELLKEFTQEQYSLLFEDFSELRSSQG